MIDLAAGGIFAAILGGNSEDIWQAIEAVRNTDRDTDIFCSYSPHRSNYWRDKYIGMLKEFTGFESVALFSTGAEATEAFWRCCRIYNGKPGIWGGLIDPDETGTDHPKSDAMHGMTLGAQIMAGRMTWAELGVFPELGETRFNLNHEATACMIMEPYHAPSAQFHRINPTIMRIMSKQKEFENIPLCMDEIQGGFGRTGKLWAFEHYDNCYDEEKKEHIDRPLKPQFITIGKGCGGGLPLSALLGPRDIMECDAVKQFGHLHSTHSGNPLMCAIGCAVIEAMDKYNLISESARKGAMLHEALTSLPVRTHGKGLLAGIEMQGPKEVHRVVLLCDQRGVQVVDTGRKWVKIGPALNIPDDVLMQGVQVVKDCVQEVVDERNCQALGDTVSELGTVN
jgi:acetylornithine/succinyldiaminopimelate/putrescine aminotransferase